MSSPILPENEPQIQPRNPFARPGPIPDIRLEGLYLERPPSLVARADSSSTSESPATTTSCGPHDTSGPCERYYDSGGSSTTLPIVLGVAIPLGVAFVLLIYLHRRHVRKLRKEDAEDKHKSLDFGLDPSEPKSRKGNGRKVPEMSVAEKKEIDRRGRGLSLDMGLNNPYLLPPELQHSRESLHSLSRSITGDDKYRTTDFIPDDGSVRPGSSLRSPIDDSSSFTGSSSRLFQVDSKQNLLRNAQDNPVGPPLSITPTNGSADAVARKPLAPPKNNTLLAPAQPDARDSFVSTTSSNGAVNALRASNNYLAQFISGGNSLNKEPSKKEPTAFVQEVKADPPSVQVQAPPPVVVHETRRSPPPPSTTALPEENISGAPSITLSLPDDRQPRLPQLSFIDSQGQQQQSIEAEPDSAKPPPISNHTSQHSNAPSTDDSVQNGASHDQSTNSIQQDHHDEDDYYDESEVHGSQDPHQRYQEYEDYQEYQDYLGTDPRRLTMGVRPLPPDDPSENPEQRANRIRSFYKEYFDETKPQHAAQHAQPYDGAEEYYDHYGPDGYYDSYYDQAAYYPPRGMSQIGTYGRHRATVSNGSYASGPRAFSSATGRYGGRPQIPPQKKLPPPKALNLLPTPSKLKEDTFLPIDFAPPQKFQNQRAGTPDSLRGGVRPYSPSMRAHVPLASSFDDLAVIPSPHRLRKSSTFTALDFAPPGRLRMNDTMSETGSIRSNGSGMSAVHLHSIRTGAYRVSRIPKEVAGTRDELTASLKPKWDLNR